MLRRVLARQLGRTTFRLVRDGPDLFVAGRFDGEQAAGEQTVRADVSRSPAGVFVARLVAAGTVWTERLNLFR